MIKQIDIQNSWARFIVEYTNEMLPIYQKHEETFDFIGFHGRRHLTRSLIFAEIIGRFYFAIGEKLLDFEGIRLAVSFHDSAREDNGVDYWELESSENCKNYLLSIGKTKEYANRISKMIPQKKEDIKKREEQIVYDVDVIEIIRVLSSQDEFKKSELLFLEANDLHKGFKKSTLDLQNQILFEFWSFIEKTEEENLSIPNEVFVMEYLKIFQKNKNKYKWMNLLYDFEWKNQINELVD